MPRKIIDKPGVIILVFAIIVLCLIIQLLGKVFFINHTPSMPQGIYAKINLSKPSIGDIIVFKITNKVNFIKYITGTSGDEFCFDENADLWINRIPVAKNNIEKYHQDSPTQSTCQSLMADEILILGEHPDSYDSRYFGPIKSSQVIAKVKLFWPFD